MNAGQSLADGAAGIALSHLETGNWPAARDALLRATAEGVSIADGASLFYGAPALAYVLASTDHPGLARARAVTTGGTRTVTRQRLERAHRRLDRHEHPHYAEYDLIRGLTGLGVVLRRLSQFDLLRDVLAYLVRLTEPRGDLPGWWVHNAPESHQSPGDGHANFGMAHGITGPLTLLALTLRDGITVDGHTTAMNRICQWLDHWQQHTGNSIWWPQTISRANLHHGSIPEQAPPRPSWCYGTPGIARAQQLTGQALNDRPRQQLAATAFVDCLNDHTQTQRLTSRGLCHGTAGLLATAHRIAADALTPVPVSVAVKNHIEAYAPPDEPEGFLDGAAGTSLATLAGASSWDACLLLS